MDDQNVVADFLKNVGHLENNALTVSSTLLANGNKEVKLDLARSKLMPEKMASPRRCHRFYDVHGFSLYVAANKSDATVVLADVTNEKIEAVLDDKAKKGFEVIELVPAIFPAFKMLTQMLNRQLPIQDFARLAMRNRRVLGDTEQEGKQFAMLMQQLTVATKIKACVGVGKKTVNGVMCTTEVKAGAGDENLIELPDTVSANVALYVNRPEQKFDIDLTVLATTHGEVDIVADGPELEVLKYQELQQMVKEVGVVLGEKAQVSIGRLSTGEWRYNK